MAAELAGVRDTAATQDMKVQSLLRDNVRLKWSGPDLQMRRRESREFQRQRKSQNEKERELLDREEKLNRREEALEARDEVMAKRWKLYQQMNSAKAETEAAKDKERTSQSRLDEQDVIITELRLDIDELTARTTRRCNRTPSRWRMSIVILSTATQRVSNASTSRL